MSYSARLTDGPDGLHTSEPEMQSALEPDTPRMQYRNRPVSVAVDPISLVISECISITSAIQKYARSPHSSVSAILGGSPNPLRLGSPGPTMKSKQKSITKVSGTHVSSEATTTSNRWGLRGQQGRSMQDNPMIAAFGKLRYEIAAIKGMAPRHISLVFLPTLTIMYKIFTTSTLPLF